MTGGTALFSKATTAKVRDPRLDFFRGIAMLIIFVAHVPSNLWTLYIPARFGWSDATEMFVFCSGFAAAIAFGGTFVKASFWYGAIRILHRAWQIYAAHICMFVFITTLVIAIDMLMVKSDMSYVDQLNLRWLLENTAQGLAGLFTLTYVPNYFDILPMYIGALMLIPIMMGLARINPFLAIGFSVVLYVASWVFGLHLPAEWHSDREWFFNPFTWQLLFFTGFSLSMGWIKPPPVRRPFVIAAAVFVIVSIPAATWSVAQHFEVLKSFRVLIWDLQNKTYFGPLRFLHFLALAYLAIAVVKGRERYLLQDWARPIITVGQNSLAVFLLSMGLAQVGGMVLDQIGRNGATFALVNLSGMMILIGFAYWCTLLKRQPWKSSAPGQKTPVSRASDRFSDGGHKVQPAE
jgi:hypothetical protein